jgi:hypothetical protein
MNRFNRKDPKVHFRELAQLRQTGTPKAYVTEFQQMAVMVTDVSEQRLVMLFHLTMRNKPRTGQNQQNFDLLGKLGKMTIPPFDGSDRCTARAWVHKLDTYFHLTQ